MELKRSTINHEIRTARTVAAHHGVSLPPWAHWDAARWEEVADDPAYEEIRG